MPLDAPHSYLINRPIRFKVVNFGKPLDTELFHLLRTRFNLEESENPEVLFYSRFRSGKRLHVPFDCLKVFYSGENDKPRPWQADLSLTFYPDSAVNVRLPYWRIRTQNDAPISNLLFASWDVDSEMAAKTDFCNFVYSNHAAKHRIDFFHKLCAYKKVNAGGKILNNIGGRVEDKLGFLRRHKFTIAFENEAQPFYATEKIVEALGARTVPIYWGDPKIKEQFNPKAFICAYDFKSLDALADYVKEVDKNDALYRSYLSEVAREPLLGGINTLQAMDNRLFTAFKNLIENPPKVRASQRPLNKIKRSLYQFLK